MVADHAIWDRHQKKDIRIIPFAFVFRDNSIDMIMLLAKVSAGKAIKPSTG